MGMPTPAQIQYMQAHIADNKQPDLIAAITICITLAYLAVAARFGARWRVRMPLMADDWWILVALVITTGFVISSLYMVHFGLGRHIILVTNPPGLIKSVVSSEILYCCSIVPIKFSIIYLYRRIFPSRRLDIAAFIVGAVVLAYSFTQAVAMGLQCIPLSSLWTGKPGKCIQIETLFTVMAVLNVLTDFIILALPIPFLWRLKVSRTRRAQLFGIFALGGCVCIFGIIRSCYVGTASPDDASWNDTYGAMWSIIEVCVGVVSACLPCLRPLFNKRAPKAGTGMSKGTNDYNAASLPLSNKPKSGWANASTDTMDAHDDKRPFARLNETTEVEATGGGQPSKSFSRPNNITVTHEFHQAWQNRG